MKQLTEQEQYSLLESLLEEAKSKIIVNPSVEVKLTLKTNSDTDTEIFIHKGFLEIYAFRCFGNNEYTFYERHNNFPNKLFTQSGLVEQLILLLR